jgi:hypothetical protein
MSTFLERLTQIEYPGSSPTEWYLMKWIDNLIAGDDEGGPKPAAETVKVVQRQRSENLRTLVPDKLKI